MSRPGYVGLLGTEKTKSQYNKREFKHARFWGAGGKRKWVVLPFNPSSHNHIYITKYLLSIRDD